MPNLLITALEWAGGAYLAATVLILALVRWESRMDQEKKRAASGPLVTADQ